jgi:hypothetical protein
MTRMSHSAQSWKRRFALAADAACLLLLGLAPLIQYAGRVRLHIGPVRLTASSGTRALLLAVSVLMVRHVVVLRPSAADRALRGLQLLRKLSISGGRRLAAVADTAVAALGVLAFSIDLAGGVEWSVGPFHLAAASGAWVAFAALAVLSVRGVISHLASTRPGPLSLKPVRASSLVFDWPSKREWLWATLAIGVATAVILRQQVLAFTSVPDLGDPLFSMWRLSWIAHQVPRGPSHLFDANIYYPATGTLAYSDAMLVPGLIAAPALWLGAPVLVVYTTLFLTTFVAAGLAMFALARAITQHAGAAVVAALVFAFDPFRFSHYSHLELQFTCWMPLALLALFRTLSAARPGDGAATGIFVSLQALCSLYYGAYLSVSLVVVAAGWIWSIGFPTRRACASLGLGVLIAGVAGVLVTIPYRANRSTVGERSQDEIRAYSATPRHYLTSSRRSVEYGMALYERQSSELELFPGTLPAVIGAGALVPPFGPLVAPTAMALVASVDASLGLNGTLYTWLNELPLFRGFRVPARFRAVAGLYLALLAGMGVGRLTQFIGSVWPRRVTVLAIAIAVLVDLRPSLELQPLWTHAPDIYARAPDHAVLADLPMPGNGGPVYVYLSTFHWHPIVNGASGFEPPWYASLVSASREFPADDTLDAFSKLGTKYFVLHEGYYRNTFPRVVAAAEAQPRLQFVATSTWEEGECRLYRLVR